MADEFGPIDRIIKSPSVKDRVEPRDYPFEYAESVSWGRSGSVGSEVADKENLIPDGRKAVNTIQPEPHLTSRGGQSADTAIQSFPLAFISLDRLEDDFSRFAALSSRWFEHTSEATAGWSNNNGGSSDDGSSYSRNIADARSLDAVLSLIATVLITIAFWASQHEVLHSFAITQSDDAMHIARIRDLLAGHDGQLATLLRSPNELGILSGGAGLNDFFLAALISILSWFFEPELAERLGGMIWPMLLLGATLYLLARITRTIADTTAVVISLLIASFSLAVITEFGPYNYSDQNFQILLFMAMVYGFIARTHWWIGCLSGVAAVLLIASEPNTQVIVTAIILVAVGYLATTPYADSTMREITRVRSVTVSLAVTLLLSSLFVFPTAHLEAASCTTYSVSHIMAIAMSALWLFMITLIVHPYQDRTVRVVSVLTLALPLALIYVTSFPNCFFASPVPTVAQAKMDQIYGAILSFPSDIAGVLTETPTRIFAYFAPIMGLIASCLLLRNMQRLHADLMLVGLLAAGVVASFINIEIAVMIGLLAAPPLAALTARLASQPGNMTAAIALLLLSLAPLHLATTQSILSREAFATPVAGLSQTEACREPNVMRQLNALPPTRVLIDVNLAAHALIYTQHMVVAAPVSGSPALIRAHGLFMGTAENIADRLINQGVQLIVVCSGGRDAKYYERVSEWGLHTRLLKGIIPNGIIEMPMVSAPNLRVFRVLPTGSTVPSL